MVIQEGLCLAIRRLVLRVNWPSSTPTARFGAGTRATNALRRGNVHTLEDLRVLVEEDPLLLAEFDGVGLDVLVDICDALARADAEGGHSGIPVGVPTERQAAILAYLATQPEGRALQSRIAEGIGLNASAGMRAYCEDLVHKGLVVRDEPRPSEDDRNRYYRLPAVNEKPARGGRRRSTPA